MLTRWSILGAMIWLLLACGTLGRILTNMRGADLGNVVRGWGYDTLSCPEQGGTR